MLTSDDLVITPLKQFYKDVIFNTMWKNWIEDENQSYQPMALDLSKLEN